MTEEDVSCPGSLPFPPGVHTKCRFIKGSVSPVLDALEGECGYRVNNSMSFKPHILRAFISRLHVCEVCVLGEIFLECSSTLFLENNGVYCFAKVPEAIVLTVKMACSCNVFRGGLSSQRTGLPEEGLSSKHIWSLGHLPEHSRRHLPVSTMVGNLHVENGETGAGEG